mmetsp:Transcript_6490/g.14794  ORF Transcript_6490/g.14794 Transcript_6490/m.14794 type:complete len:266 (+) Transcript_6490:762-1559(+)
MASSETLSGGGFFRSPRAWSMRRESWMVAIMQRTTAWLSLSSNSCTNAMAFLAARKAAGKFWVNACTSATSKSDRASHFLSFSFWKMNCASVAQDTAWSSSEFTRWTVLMISRALPSACLSPDFVRSSLASLAALIASIHFSLCMCTLTARWCAEASSAGSSNDMQTGTISLTQDSTSVNSLRSSCTLPIVCSSDTCSLLSLISLARDSASSALDRAVSLSFSSMRVLARSSSTSISRLPSPASRKDASDFFSSLTPASGSLFFT